MKNYLSAFILSLSVLLASCAALGNQINANRNITRIELDMPKRDVVKIMGNTYEVVGSRQTGEGPLETIGYLNGNNDIYLLTFLNGRLVEYHKEWLSRHDHDRRPVGSVGAGQNSSAH